MFATCGEELSRGAGGGGAIRDQAASPTLGVNCHVRRVDATCERAHPVHTGLITMSTARTLPLCLLAGATLVMATAAACQRQATHTPSAMSESAAEARATTVDVDLSSAGIAATIRGPEQARAKAKDDFVEVEAGDDFHMEIHRGAPDMLERKAEIVRRWGPRFRGFVRDDTDTVIYETGRDGSPRFHFLTRGRVEGLDYFCNTADDGVGSLVAIDVMMNDCHSITAHPHATLASTATP